MNRILLIFVLSISMILPIAAKPAMALLPAGKMQVSKTFSDPITISLDSFELAKYEVTVGEFRKFVKASGYKSTAIINESFFGFFNGTWTETYGNSWEDPGYEQTDNHPVGGLSWYDAISYCNWLSAQEGLKPVYKINKKKKDPNNKNDEDDFMWTVTWNKKANGYRLPTTMEWEYAAREGGKKIIFPWGNDEIQDLKNPRVTGNLADKSFHDMQDEDSYYNYSDEDYMYDEDDDYDNYDDYDSDSDQEPQLSDNEYDDGYAFTAPVGSFEPNSYGIYDLSGNVSEFCWDWFDKSYYPKDGSKNPQGPDKGYIHAQRGSAWCDNGYETEIVYRRDLNTSYMNFVYMGIRLARSVKKK